MSDDTIRSTYEHLCRPFFIAFRILGFCPYINNQNGELCKKCLSWSTVYVVLLWLIDFYANLTLLSTLFEKKSISPINASRFNKALLLFAKSMFFAAPSLLVPVTMWFEVSKLEIYLEEWANFQKRYSNLIGNSSISKTIRVQVIQLFRSILIILIAFGTTLMLTTTKTNVLQLFCMMKSVSTMAYITTFWFVSTKIIVGTTEEFKNKFQMDLKNPIFAATIEDYRLLWIHMSKLIRESGNFMSGTMTFCIFYTTIFAILTVYLLTVWGGKLVEQKDYTTLILAFAACIINTMSLYVYCNSGYKQTKKVTLFLNALNQYQPIVNVLGFYEINRGLFGSILSLLVTYLIVLIQLNSSFSSTESSNFNRTITNNTQPTQ